MVNTQKIPRETLGLAGKFSVVDELRKRGTGVLADLFGND